MPAPCLQGEGPSIFKPSDGNYYMMASHLTYWKPNPPMLYHAAAASLASAKWNMLPTPAAGPTANTTHDSQSSSIFSLQLEDGSSMFVYMGDRWNFYGPGSVRLEPSQVIWICVQHILKSAQVTRSLQMTDCLHRSAIPCTDMTALGIIEWRHSRSVYLGLDATRQGGR